MKKAIFGCVLIVAMFLVVSADSCSSSGLPGSTPSASSVHGSPTAFPTPAPTPFALSGSGSKVSEPFVLAKGNYRVSWTATGGSDNFIVDIRAGSDSENLVNEIPPKPSNGEAFFQAGGGQYFLEIKASTLTWTITFSPI